MNTVEALVRLRLMRDDHKQAILAVEGKRGRWAVHRSTTILRTYEIAENTKDMKALNLAINALEALATGEMK